MPLFKCVRNFGVEPALSMLHAWGFFLGVLGFTVKLLYSTEVGLWKFGLKW